MSDEKQPTRMGRPPRFPDEGPRTNHSLRLKPSVSKALREAAEINNRSLAEEMEFRLNMSVEAGRSKPDKLAVQLSTDLQLAEIENAYLQLQRQIDLSKARIDAAVSIQYALSMRRVSVEYRDGTFTRFMKIARAKFWMGYNFKPDISRETMSNKAEIREIDSRLEMVQVDIETSKAELSQLRARRIAFYQEHKSFRPPPEEKLPLDLAALLYVEKLDDISDRARKRRVASKNSSSCNDDITLSSPESPPHGSTDAKLFTPPLNDDSLTASPSASAAPPTARGVGRRGRA